MHGKPILITGCSNGGLGAALAVACHQADWRVFASARSSTKLGEVKAAGIETIILDVQDEGSLAGAVADVSSRTGGSLDALVNNAGAGLWMPMIDISISETRKLFEVNVFSHSLSITLTTDALRHELVPFGIKVVELKTGQLASKFFSNIGKNDYSIKLPPNSMYQVAHESVEEVMIGQSIKAGKRQTAQEWAKKCC